MAPVTFTIAAMRAGVPPSSPLSLKLVSPHGAFSHGLEPESPEAGGAPLEAALSLLRLAPSPALATRLTQLAAFAPHHQPIAPMLVHVIARGVARLAAAFGGPADELLRFLDVEGGESLIGFRNVTIVRSDRVWGGPATYTLHFSATVTLDWPDPGPALFHVLEGEIASASHIARAGAGLSLRAGACACFLRHSVIAVRQAPLTRLIRYARAAGLEFTAPVAGSLASPAH